ncbi:biotin--[acetyl-CoA-carboxylase] ligase [Desulfovibrio mangrovi]|uniref:biotin--[acetyl-CoA-carboxylase] ligase n=1 Tax=Desulfovibrio mangrovi TaxID=2976983 RepID=UPI002245A9E0|nr:biotin--[acetyl-CoA-carboxylase] ligase [Desulfovibrio mangrovi]UZP68260.1 biotin--[acetyl-CoA-carboxylase] ligase [Desulfovibrio mangrovi]
MLYILKDGLSDVASPLSPEELADSSPVWGDEIRSARWAECELNGLRLWATSDLSVRKEERGSAEAEQSVFICGACSSSLDVVRILAREGLVSEWDSVLALSQSAGRGQLRRPWSSPAGNIYSALRLPYGTPHLDDIASLTVGYLLAEAFSAQGVRVALKWPNDLLLGDKKTGGILLEDVGGALFAGIGVNVVSSPPVRELRDGWAVPATNLREEGFDLSVTTLWQTLVNQVRFCYETQVVRCNREELTRRVQLHLAWVGREIIIHGGDEEYRPGRLLGVNENGALRLLLSGHEYAVHSGSIALSSHTDLPI